MEREEIPIRSLAPSRKYDTGHVPETEIIGRYVSRVEGSAVRATGLIMLRVRSKFEKSSVSFSTALVYYFIIF